MLVTVVMDRLAGYPYGRATVSALEHAAAQMTMPVDVRILRTDQVSAPRDLIRESDAIVIGPGSPHIDPDAAIECIREAREAGVPLVGT